MRVVYDPDNDILQISLTDSSIEETAQITPGLILDYDEDGTVIGLELRNASKRVSNPYGITYLLGEADQNKPQPKLN